MKRYQINEKELNFLMEMVSYMQDGNEVSDKGDQEIREVFDRIASRPILDIEIDPKVFEEIPKGETNDEA